MKSTFSSRLKAMGVFFVGWALVVTAAELPKKQQDNSATEKALYAFPFGITRETQPDRVRKILEAKSAFYEASWSTDRSLTFYARELVLNGIEFRFVSISYHKDRIFSVAFESATIKEADGALRGLAKVKSFYEGQGRKVTVDGIEHVKKGGDLMRGDTLVSFHGSPCLIDIRSSYSDGFHLSVHYTDMDVLSQRLTDLKEETDEGNKKAEALLNGSAPAVINTDRPPAPHLPAPPPPSPNDSRQRVLGEKGEQTRVPKARFGTIAVDARWSNYGAYLQKMIDTVQIQWERLIIQMSAMPAGGSTVTVKFIMNYEGQIIKILHVDSRANETGSRACVSAITDRAPYGPWTDDMRTALGTQQEMSFTFSYQ